MATKKKAPENWETKKLQEEEKKQGFKAYTPKGEKKGGKK